MDAARIPVRFLCRILHTPDRVLHFADSFGRLAFHDHLLIADGFTHCFFSPARDGLRGAFNTVLIHGRYLSCLRQRSQGSHAGGLLWREVGRARSQQSRDPTG